MSSSSAGNVSLQQTPRDPNLAALLSIIPGLGQLYNGETRKGLSFIAVSLINLLILLVIIANQYIVSALFSFGLAFHMRPDSDLVSALSELHLGSTISFIIIGMFLTFISYAIRDAYDHALFHQRKHIYPEYVLEMPEATSISYVLHFLSLIIFFILAVFFLKQSRPLPQITDIEFVQNQPITHKKIESQKRAEKASEAAGKHDEKKPVVAPSPAPKAPSKPAPKAAPQPVVRPMPTRAPTPHPNPTLKPMPAPVPHPIAAPRPTMAPTPTSRPMPMPTANPTSSPNPTPMPAPTASRKGNFAPAPAPTIGTGPVISGAPGPAPVAVSRGTGGGSQSPMPVPAGGSSSGRSSSGGSASAPAPTRGGRSGGGSGWSGPALITPSVPRAAGGGGGEGTQGNPEPNGNPNHGPSVAAQADIDFGPYMADLQRRIKRAWFPPKGNESKRVVVVFKVHKGGELSNLRLDHSSGVASADQAALKAVENAAPFRPLPAGAADDVDIQFTFDYNVFSGGSSGLFRRF